MTDYLSGCKWATASAVGQDLRRGGDEGDPPVAWVPRDFLMHCLPMLLCIAADRRQPNAAA